MMGMKKPPIAASVSIRPIAEPMCSARMLLTLEGTANQAAKPKMRKKPIPIPRGQSKMLGATGMRANKAATVTSGPTTNIRRLVLRSAQCPPSTLPGMPAGGRPMTEDLPLAAAGVKGRARVAMTAELLAAANAGRVRIAIGRAADFFGPGVTGGSTLGERVFGNALAGRRADFIGNPSLPHTYSYVPDIAAGLATLGTDPRAAGQVWHLPGPATVTTRALLGLVAGQVGHPVGIRSLPKLAVRALGLVNPTLRELTETYYQFDQPFVLDTSKYQATFGAAGTPLADAIAATLAWYRTRPGTP